jgi:TolA-binding protein
MEQSQQRQVNEAAEKFAEAIEETYQALADSSVSAQELHAQLTQDFFNGVINNLRTQAESNRGMAEDLVEQQRKQHESFQTLTQESVDVYTDFLNSMFSYYRGPYAEQRVGGSGVGDSTDHTDESSDVTVWKETGQGARESYLSLLERTGEMKPGSRDLPADFWDLPRPEDPNASVRRAVQEDRR